MFLVIETCAHDARVSWQSSEPTNKVVIPTMPVSEDHDRDDECDFNLPIEETKMLQFPLYQELSNSLATTHA